jgi:hypothetical protein
MPYKSEKQRRFLHAKHPGIAARWDKTYGGKVEKSIWGVVHKMSPDPSALHVMGTGGRIRRLTKVKGKPVAGM